MPGIHEFLNLLRDAYAAWGYPIVFLGAFLENTVLLGLILPGGALVMLGAVYAHQGSMALPAVFLLAWLGMVAGTSIDYLLGRFGFRSLLAGTRLATRLEAPLGQAERFLERRGAWAFLLAHFAGHVRSFVAITAGMTTLPYKKFLLYEGLAAFAWNAIFVGAGYLLAGHLDQLQRLMNGSAVVLAVGALAAYGAYRLIRRRRAHAPAVS